MKNALLRRTSVLLLFVFLISSVQAQLAVSRSYIPPSPNATSLGMFVDANRGNYSGLVDISIPIYEINTGTLKLPISLSYYSGGIKYSDEASNVGLNWALNAGGVVGRIKKDRDDLATRGFFQINPANRSCSKEYDQEPDMFYFNFNGFTGKFVLLWSPNSPGGFTIRQIKGSNLKIAIGASGWQITTPDGTIYIFSKEEKTTEQLTSDDQNETTVYTSAWYLTSITAVNNEKIELTYNESTNKIRRTFNQSSTHKYWYFTPSYAGPCLYNLGIRMSAMGSQSVVDADEISLAAITFPNGQVTFNSSASRVDLNTTNGPGRKINSIVVSKVSSEPIKQFDFEYDYYATTGTAFPDYFTKRLRLIKVQERNGSTYKAPYLFSYGLNYTELKNIQSIQNLGYWLTGAQALISKITFPTGGYSTYEFESSPLTDMQGTPLTGGARIKRIEQNDGISGGRNIKKFEYGAGRLLGVYRPGLINQYTQTLQMNDCIQGNGVEYATVYWKDETYSDLTSLGEMSDNVVTGFDNVTVLYGDNGENGKTVQEFENNLPASAPTYPGLVRFFMPIDVSQRHGLLKSITDYKKEGAGFVPLQRTENTYTSSDVYTVGSRRKVSTDCYNYGITTELIQNTGQKTIMYDQAGANPMTTETSNTFNASQLPVTTTTTNSKGESLVTNYKYPAELAGGGNVYSTMVASNVLSPVVEQNVRNNGILTSYMRSDYKDWGAQGKVFAPERTTIFKGELAVGLSRKNITEFYNYDTKGNVLESALQNDAHTSYIWGYNKSYPIAQVENATAATSGYTGFESDDDIYWNPIGYMWSLSNEAYTGKRSYKCLQAGWGTGGIWQKFLPPTRGKYRLTCRIKTPASFTGNAVVQLSTGQVSSPETVYPTVSSESMKTLQVGNTGGEWKLCTVTIDLDKIYSDLGSVVPLAIATKISNTDPDNYFLIDDVRFQPVDAKMTTYTYDPLIGMTSETSANNKSLFYEYDALGRLRLIRDNERYIIKKICYNYTGQAESCPATAVNYPDWQQIGQSRCKPCPLNPAYNSGEGERQEMDMNTNSSTYGNVRWVADPSANCPTAADWQPRTDLSYCEMNASGQWTGNRITPTWNANPCSPTYAQWGTPIVTPNAPECRTCTPACQSPQYKCYQGSCIPGEWKVVKVVRVDKFTWKCTRAWCYPDGTVDTSTSQTTTGTTACTIECL